MDLRKNDKSRRVRWCVGGLWELLLVVSCILLSGCTFTSIVGMGFFYVLFPYTRIFKCVSCKWQLSTVIWNQ